MIEPDHPLDTEPNEVRKLARVRRPGEPCAPQIHAGFEWRRDKIGEVRVTKSSAGCVPGTRLAVLDQARMTIADLSPVFRPGTSNAWILLVPLLLEGISISGLRACHE